MAEPGRGNIIDGTAIAEGVLREVRDEVEKLTARGITPGLSVILVGEDPASAVYVRSKDRKVHALDATTGNVR